MSVTSAQLYNDIMYSLLEDADSGAAEPVSSLYTRAQVIASINLKLYEFMKRTGVYVKNAQTQAATSGTRDIAIPTDVIDLLEVSFQSPTNGYTVIPQGSVYEGDLFIADTITSVDTPSFYSIEDAPTLSISLIPPPNSTNTARYCYTARPAALTSPPDTTALTCPDDLTPFVKFGALAELFNKSGETYDPFRAKISEQLFELGVETARAWVSGSQT